MAHPPFCTGAALQLSQDDCALIHGWQQASHTLQSVTVTPHAAVLFSWPQLFGTTHFLQVLMHSPGDCEPLGSSLHWPVATLQLYMVGVGGGVGAGVGFGKHFESQLPVLTS